MLDIARLNWRVRRTSTLVSRKVLYIVGSREESGGYVIEWGIGNSTGCETKLSSGNISNILSAGCRFEIIKLPRMDSSKTKSRLVRISFDCGPKQRYISFACIIVSQQDSGN